MKGYIACALLWNRWLEDTEILELYHQTRYGSYGELVKLIPDRSFVFVSQSTGGAPVESSPESNYESLIRAILSSDTVHEALFSPFLSQDASHESLTSPYQSMTPPHESLITPTRSLIVPHEALTRSLLSSEPVHESLTPVDASGDADYEAQVQIIQTDDGTHESLTPVSLETPPSFEALAFMYSSLEVPHEVISTSIASYGEASYESLGFLYSATDGSHEAETTTLSATQAVHESLLSAAVLSEPAHESLVSVSVLPEPGHEAVAFLASSTQTGHESLASLSSIGEGSYEVVSPATVSYGTPAYESLASLSVESPASWEGIVQVFASTDSSHESLVQPQISLDGSHEALYSTYREDPASFESLETILLSADARHESVSAAGSSSSTGLEVLASVVATSTSDWATSGVAQSVFQVAHVAAGFLDLIVPVQMESISSGITSAGLVAAEARGVVFREFVIDYPSLAFSALQSPIYQEARGFVSGDATPAQEVLTPVSVSNEVEFASAGLVSSELELSHETGETAVSSSSVVAYTFGPTVEGVVPLALEVLASSSSVGSNEITVSWELTGYVVKKEKSRAQERLTHVSSSFAVGYEATG